LGTLTKREFVYVKKNLANGILFCTSQFLPRLLPKVGQAPAIRKYRFRRHWSVYRY
jgi:hypothetical protein